MRPEINALHIIPLSSNSQKRQDLFALGLESEIPAVYISDFALIAGKGSNCTFSQWELYVSIQGQNWSYICRALQQG